MFVSFCLQSFATWESENKIHCKQTLVDGDGPKTFWTRELNGDQLTLVSIEASETMIALGFSGWDCGSGADLGLHWPVPNIWCALLRKELPGRGREGRKMSPLVGKREIVSQERSFHPLLRRAAMLTWQSDSLHLARLRWAEVGLKPHKRRKIRFLVSELPRSALVFLVSLAKRKLIGRIKIFQMLLE